MRKIYHIIPGKQIEDVLVMNSIFDLISSVEFEKWLEVNEKIYSMDFFYCREEFYVMYLDPLGVVKKLYITPRNEILNFMKEYINYEYGEGVDIAICANEMKEVVVCNHDGQIYIFKV